MITVHDRHLKRDITFRIKILLAFTATLLGFLTLMTALAQPAKADLAGMGNTDPNNNFPTYFQDTNGLQLGLCLDGPPDGPPINCLASKIENQAPNDEAFWFAADASLPTSGGKDSQLVLAQEAAYFGGDPPDGQEAAFQRVRVILQVNTPGTYTVTYPYGTKTYKVAQEDIGPGREVFDTLDKGCFPSPPEDTCYDGAGIEFSAAVRGPLGPFLTWDTISDPNPTLRPPVGFIGDAATPHKVIGSPVADATDPSGFQNYFKIEGPNVGGPGVNVVQTDLFTVQGKIHGVTAFPSVKGGIYNTDQNVSFTPSDPAAKVVYTTGDGSQADPAVDPATGEITTGTDASVTPALITDTTTPNTDTTTLKYIAARLDNATGQWVSSPVLSQTYTIDKVVPAAPTELTLAPESDSGVAGDNLTNVTTPKLSGKAEAKSTVKVFDAATSTPTLLGQTIADAAGNWAFTVPNTKALSSQGLHNINATSTDAAANASGKSADLGVTLDTVVPKVAASPGQGVYGPTQKFTLTPNEAARVYFTTDTTIPDASDTEYTAPLSFASNTTLKYIGIDTAGNRSQVATQVYTIDRVSPKVVLSSRTPAPNAVGVAAGTNVTASFNEAVKGVGGTTFTLKRGTTKVAATVTYNATTRKAVLNPNANLAPKTKYTVTLTSGIKDSVGNPLVPLSWSFTTR